MTADEPGTLRSEPARRFGLRVTALFAGTLLAASLFGVVLLLVRAKNSVVHRWDSSVAEHLHRFALDHRSYTRVMQTISDAGAPPAWWAILFPVTAWLVWRRRYRLAAFVVVTTVGSSLLNRLIKATVGRARPHLVDPVSAAGGASFPSGHAQAALVGWGVLLLVFLPYLPDRWRRPAIAFAAVVVLAIGYSRIALGVHYLFDVVGAYLVGAVWLVGLTLGFRAWRRELGEPVPEVSEGLEPDGPDRPVH
ncbi:phosphatase PAP2 family protein [Jatrophihabitans telluris]|uniref:Phosphatase PAP2 family protein n=1 Tax=Jatrophihabitans telluris TaxID=2038343 RepID=A0ABY4QYW6_9ACTN|nr:phosphatase PAP2 family protein [Jatrophihabitans telluris]UQX88206.1 phosphatase PAP2 family protein [Jatrophihabitans telluris]